jgi:hypothetical protein
MKLKHKTVQFPVLGISLLLCCGGDPVVDMTTQEVGEGEEGSTPDMPPTDMPVETLCDGMSVDLQTDPRHCGECDNHCPSVSGDDPDLDLDHASCVSGTCQNFWTGCVGLPAFEGQSCTEFCGANGCQQGGCAGQTVLVWRGVKPEGIGGEATCTQDTTAVDLQDAYSCDDLLTTVTVPDGDGDYFSCCCGPI